MTGKQPARLTAHPAVRRAHKDPTPHPFSDQTTLPPAGAAASAGGGCWCGRCWVVAGQEVVLQGVGRLAALRVPLLLGGEWRRVAEVGFERKGRAQVRRRRGRKGRRAAGCARWGASLFSPARPCWWCVPTCQLFDLLAYWLADLLESRRLGYLATWRVGGVRRVQAGRARGGSA